MNTLNPSAGSPVSLSFAERILLPRFLLPLLLLPLLLFASLTSSASASLPECETCRPWLHLSSGSRPANLHAGLRQNEVQELSVNATGGTYTLRVPTAAGTGTVTDTSAEITEVGLSSFGVFHVGDEIEAVMGLKDASVFPHGTTITAVGPGTLTLSHPDHLTNGFAEILHLFVKETTAPIAPNATAAEVQAAITALLGPGNVSVTGSGPYRITFTGEYGDRALQLVAPDPSSLQGAAADATIVEVSQGHADGEIVLLAENVGDANLGSEGTPLKITDVLPPHLRALAIGAKTPGPHGGIDFPVRFPCTSEAEVKEGKPLTCTLSRKLVPYDTAEIRIAVDVEPGAQTGERNQASTIGGGAPAASAGAPITISPGPTPFSVAEYRLSAEAEGGAPVSVAASHPFQVTGAVTINQLANTAPVDGAGYGNIEPAVLAKDIKTELPPGLLGDATRIPTCSLAQFLTVNSNTGESACPSASAVGVSSVTVAESTAGFGTLPFVQPVYNLEPAFGEPARFGFFVGPGSANAPVVLDTSLRSGPGESLSGGSSPDYGIDVIATNISQIAGLSQANVTFWGTPGDPRHDNSRGFGCLYETRETYAPHTCLPSEAPNPPPLLEMPTSCAGPLPSAVTADPWVGSGVFVRTFSEPLPTLDACNQVPFSPTTAAEPTADSASSPSGFNFDLNVKDEGLANSNGRIQSQINKAVVTFPESFTANPSVAAGLGACSEAQYDASTDQPGTGCPENSKIGEAEVESPLVTKKLHGSLYIATQDQNPNHNLLTIYMVIQSSELGVLIKSAGRVDPNPVTGQLTTTFENIPQVPFSHFRFSLRQGQRAPLVTPPTCGAYTVNADLYPWSNPTVPLLDESSFQITSGVGGASCPSGAPPFAPRIAAGMQNNNAGAFSEFDLHLSRGDADQEISGFSTDLPAGLTGDLSGIPFCPEADIAAARTRTGAQEGASPSCPASSYLGRSLVGTGVGEVLAYTPGRLYLGGPYNGDPFSLVSVTSAVVGPFDLGAVVLRFGLKIDPHTAQVSVDPTASEPIPTILKGIVTHVRDIRVYVDRPNFTLNPTSCAPMAISSTLNSDLGQSATVSSPFQAASCANLKFQPDFKVSTSGKTSKAFGASLTVKLSYPNVPQGTEANIRQVKVELPKQLPSRLTTLQKACTAKQFNLNPAGCPAASIIGHAKAITPLIPVPLEGPAYFVSNGGEAFPNLIMVLQGYGVTIDLVGSTFISKAGITSSTFKAVPDQPVGSFELTLPEGKYSALAANGNLCTSKLAMPTEFLAQNGMRINQSTPVRPTGCAKKKALTRAQKLAAALKACNKKAKGKRAACHAGARRRYGLQAKRKATSKAKKK